ncbi:hypothetical protein SAMCCGM7_pC1906 (plasmid) [Sinorhizobium americanum CCGM7]|nr:hypothetical protein SAMCCGM7_pC1906 [Sinorhizobium americanum CCGM7]
MKHGKRSSRNRHADLADTGKTGYGILYFPGTRSAVHSSDSVASSDRQALVHDVSFAIVRTLQPLATGGTRAWADKCAIEDWL